MKKSVLWVLISVGILLTAVGVFFVVMFVAAVSSKPKREEPTPAHVHTFLNDWTTDETYHWHEATCEHTDEVSQKGEHVWNEGVLEFDEQSQTGSVVFTCMICGRQRTEQVAEATGLACNFYDDIGPNAQIAGVGDWEQSEVLVVPKEIDGYPVTSIRYDAFKNNQTIKILVLPETVTSVFLDAFNGCSNLSKIVFYSDTLYIDKGAFAGCNLSIVDFGDKHVTIGEHAFENNPIGSLALGNNVLLGKGSLRNINTLYSVSLPSNLTKIPDGLLSGCSRLSSVSIPNGVTEIGDNAFERTSLGAVRIPASVETIGRSAFGGCANLTTVVFDEGSALNHLDFTVFEGCTRLLKIELPHSSAEELQMAGDVFKGCTMLKFAVVPENVVIINWSMFENCTSLEYVIIEGLLTGGFAQDAFKNCPSLARVYYKGTPEDLEYRNNDEDEHGMYNKQDETIFSDQVTWYFYSEEQPQEAGNFWHYEEGVIVVWE